MENFKKIEREVDKILPKSPIKEEIMHSKLVLKWVLRLKPDADDSLKIAAISHDIDRAISKITEKDLKDYSKIDEFKKDHAIRSAKYILDILQQNNCSKEIMKKVKNLVENHEVGGDDETNILKDADSLAYFEYNIPFYLVRNGKERTIGKIRFMFDRMSDDAKKMIKEIEYKDKEISEIIEESLNKR